MRAARLLTGGAALAALGFAVHPLRVEPVAWISDRRDLLCATFLLLALMAHVRGARKGGPLERGWLLASLAAFAAALGSKGVAAVLPLLPPPAGLVSAGPRRAGLARADPARKTPHLALALGGVVVTATWPCGPTPLPSATGSMGRCRGSPWPDTPRGCCWCGTSGRPASPSLRIARPRIAPRPRFLFPLLAVTALTAVLVRLRHRWPAGIAAWLASLILLAPVSGIVLAGRHVGADRYAYLAGLGLALLAGGSAVQLVARRSATARWITGVVRRRCSSWELGMLAWQQTLHWRDSERLWRRAVSVEPDCASCLNNLGRALMRADAGRPSEDAEAEALFRRALTLRPDQQGPYLNLGALLVGLGRLDEAEGMFREIARRWPDIADGPAGLAAVSLARGDEAAAATLLRRALALDPAFVGARVELGQLLNNRGVAAAQAWPSRESRRPAPRVGRAAPGRSRPPPQSAPGAPRPPRGG